MNSRTQQFLATLLTLGLFSFANAQESEWPVHLANHKAPEAGEHPRLLFRKCDLPALR